MNPLHHQMEAMDDTAEYAVKRQHFPGEACTEIGANATPVRLSPWQWIKRWWRRGQLRAELADLEADAAALEQDLDTDRALAMAMPERWQRPEVQALHLNWKRQLRQLERRIASKRSQIADITATLEGSR